MSVEKMRKEYELGTLSEETVSADPFEQFRDWWNKAVESGIEEVNAMTLATSSSDGVPSARIVLLKGFDETGFVFYTNYESFKARQLEENPRACLVFFWKELERQVRITGLASRVDPAESDAYFASRPLGSRIGAWTSPQSQVITGRAWLLETEKKFKDQFREGDIERPPHWGGYRIRPVTFEFWQGRSNRLHDRILYNLEAEGRWKIERLAP